jgi:hypothetical protein
MGLYVNNIRMDYMLIFLFPSPCPRSLLAMIACPRSLSVTVGYPRSLPTAPSPLICPGGALSTDLSGRPLNTITKTPLYSYTTTKYTTMLL